jgi:hypothetical protein
MSEKVRYTGLARATNDASGCSVPPLIPALFLSVYSSEQRTRARKSAMLIDTQ